MPLSQFPTKVMRRIRAIIFYVFMVYMCIFVVHVLSVEIKSVSNHISCKLLSIGRIVNHDNHHINYNI